MAYELGILLGEYAGSQSFENVGSWDLQTTQSSLTLETTNTHSSTQNANILVSSGANGALSYNYAANNDLYDRWFTGVTTHTVVTYFWGRASASANSGDVTAVSSSDSVPIAFSNSLDRYRLETQITSETGISLDFDVTSFTGADFNYYIDDVVNAVDVIELHPDLSFNELANQNVALHTSLKGRETAFLWGQYGAWDVPLTHVNDLQASLMNQWWRDSRNLYFTFNTSDTNNMFIVRIVNETNPFISVSRPYNNYFAGTLKLETVHYSLDY